MLRVKNNIATEIMKHLIARKMSAYDLLNNNTFKRSRVNPVCHGTEPVSYPSPKLCDLVPNEVRNLNLSMLSNSKSKDGPLTDVFSEIKLYVTIIIVYLCITSDQYTAVMCCY